MLTNLFLCLYVSIQKIYMKKFQLFVEAICKQDLAIQHLGQTSPPDLLCVEMGPGWFLVEKDADIMRQIFEVGDELFENERDLHYAFMEMVLPSDNDVLNDVNVSCYRHNIVRFERNRSEYVTVGEWIVQQLTGDKLISELPASVKTIDAITKKFLSNIKFSSGD